jgi:hypothetical protein
MNTDTANQTTFIQKAIAPSAQRQLSVMEKWGYNLLNAGIVGGATAVTSGGGLAIAHSAGVSDIPAVGWHMMLIIFIGGAVGKIMIFLSQGLPKLDE